MAYEIKRFPYAGTIDADGHVLEPPDLWENYLEAKYRDRALRIRVDDDGFEYLEINGQPSARSNKGSLGMLGAMGEDDMRPACRATLCGQHAVRFQRYARAYRPA